MAGHRARPVQARLVRADGSHGRRAHAECYMKGSIAVLFLFYVGLWTIKMSFLVFFYRLGEQVTYYRVSWWILTTVTVASGAVCGDH